MKIYNFLILLNLGIFVGSFYKIWFGDGDSGDAFVLVYAAFAMIVLTIFKDRDDKND